MKRSFSYRLWKHLNKRMVRLSETGKFRFGDRIRFKIWKRLSQKRKDVPVELINKIKGMFAFRKAPFFVIRSMFQQHEQKMHQMIQDVQSCSTLVEAMIKEIKGRERNSLDRRVLFQDLLFHHCRSKEIEQKKVPKTIMLTSYHYNDGIPLVQNNIIFPVQTGAALTDFRFGCETDIRNGISEKNDIYAELTTLYWGLKSYLPQHPDIEYIGIGQHYRFLDLMTGSYHGNQDLALSDYLWMLNFYKPLYLDLCDADIIVPEATHNGQMTVFDQWCNHHPKEVYLQAEELVLKKHPKMKEAVEQMRQQNACYFWNSFCMKRDLFEEYANWLFDLLFQLDKQTNSWEEYQNLSKNHGAQRIPAFLSERLFNIWVFYQKSLGKKIREKGMYKIIKEKENDN